MTFFKNNETGNNQNGLASIMVVGVLIILLSLVTVGFARLMNRELNQTLNNQLATSATFAAESGLNDAVTLVRDNPTLAISDCSDGIRALTDNSLPNNISTPESNAEYSCLLINPSPKDIQYNLSEGTSQIAKLTPKNGTIADLMFSWESTFGYNNYDNLAGQPLLSESAWNGAGNTPILRVTLYPVGLADSLAPTGNSRTFFFYPETNGGNNNVTTIDYMGNNGLLAGVRCGSTNVGTFLGSADARCNVIISGLSASGGNAYFAKITPIYSPARVIIKGDTTVPVNSVEFIGTQSVVDVTAKSVDSVKRLQARATINDTVNNIKNESQDSIPEVGLRSASTLCKRLVVPSDGSQVYTDTSINGTSCNVVTLPPPTLNLYINNPGTNSLTINPGAPANNLIWTTTNSSRCTASGSWSGAKAPGGGTESTGVLNNPQLYTYNLECFNALNVSSGVRTVTINVVPPCPVPTAQTLNPFSITDTSAYISGTVNPGSCANLFSFFQWNQGGSISSSPSRTPNVALTTNGGNQSSSPQLTGLTPNTQYTYQICVTYASICGAPVSFTTLPAGGGGGGGGGSAPRCLITSSTISPAPVGGRLSANSTYTFSGTFSHCYNGCRGFGTMGNGFPINYSNNYASDNNVPGSGPVTTGGTEGWGGVRCYSRDNTQNAEVAFYVNPPNSNPGPGPGPGPGPSFTYSNFSDCNFGDGQPGGYPTANMCRADGGVWTTFCRRQPDGATRLGGCPPNF